MLYNDTLHPIFISKPTCHIYNVSATRTNPTSTVLSVSPLLYCVTSVIQHRMRMPLSRLHDKDLKMRINKKQYRDNTAP